MISFFADGKTEAQGDEVICESTGIQAQFFINLKPMFWYTVQPPDQIRKPLPFNSMLVTSKEELETECKYGSLLRKVFLYQLFTASIDTTYSSYFR